MDVLTALGQSTRIGVLRELYGSQGAEGLPAGVLAERLSVPHNTLSVHLKILEAAGLVTSERRSRQIIYRGRREAMTSLIDFLQDLMSN